MSIIERIKEAKELLRNGGPAFCQVAITNQCNARCRFCSFPKVKKQDRVIIDPKEMEKSIDILYDRGVRYIQFTGGEPLLHPYILDMIAYSTKKDMISLIGTNGSLLTPKMIEGLKESGLKVAVISIDGTNAKVHEENRGIPNLCRRIFEANKQFKALGINSCASVTISRLIEDYPKLFPFLKSLGFNTMTFSYPLKELKSSYLGFSDSTLVDFRPEELVEIFQKLISLKKRYKFINPTAALKEVIHYWRRQKVRFPCFGGYKNFFLDWNLDVYRCPYFREKMSNIYDFKHAPLIRDGCNLCMMDCWFDPSVSQYFVISLADAISYMKKGDLIRAIKSILDPNNLISLKSFIEFQRSGGWVEVSS